MIASRFLVRTSLTALQANRTRSALTILGIVIGISSVILIVGLGRGAEELILKELGGFGAEMIVVRPGQEPKGPTDIAGTIYADSLKPKDVDALRRKSNVPFAKNVVPFVIVPGSVSYQGETMQPQIMGGSAEFMSVAFNLPLSSGRMYTDIETRQRASVAVIGPDVQEELFGLSESVGEKIKIKGRNFRVVGVLSDEGQSSLFAIGNLIMIPETTAQTYLLGTDHFQEVIVEVTSAEMVARTVIDIEATVRESHSIDDPDKDDFFVVTQEGVVKQVEAILGALTVFLSSVVAISLVVGGVGVMNIMLVSVTERTREIGLRKAVGATNRDIMSQFLLEAVMLTVAGGIIGILIGLTLTALIAIVLTQFVGLAWEFAFSPVAVGLGLAMAALVGVVFGLYPARQAARKSPIEALRYE